MNLDFDLSGMVARLDGCAEEVRTKGKRKALRAGGKVIEKTMKARAPVLESRTAQSTALPPGAVRDGIRTYVHDGEDGEPEALIGPAAKVEHVARWVEFGHRQVKGGYSKVLANGRTRGPGKAAEVDVPAHPFLRPAYEESREAALAAEQASLAETIEKAVS